MTLAKKFTGGLALAVGLTLGIASAQNGSNYHVLSNQADAAFIGIGAGGGQVAGVDGIGTFIAGEDMRGSVQVDFGSLGIQYSYRNPQFRETMCVFVVPPSGTTSLQFPGLLFIELDGTNGNDPSNFINPPCGVNLPSFIPYGVGPASSFSFLLSGLPSGIGATGVPTGATILLPNNGLIPTTAGGTATILAAAGGINLTVATGGSSAGLGCWLVQFTWTPSALTFLDNIDGMWHYALNGQDANQYWLMSSDEMNIWQSQSLLTDAGVSGVIAFFAAADYEFTMMSSEPVVHSIEAPHGAAQNGVYYSQTENMVGGGAPNFGFDVGRGHIAVSMTGVEGVGSAGGASNQDPANNTAGGTVPSLGFATWDNAADSLANTTRVHDILLEIDYPMLNNFTFPFVPPANPEDDPGIQKGFSYQVAGGKVRLPIHATGFYQAVTELGRTTFTHVTANSASGWPDPSGIASGAFGVDPVAGGTFQLNVLPFDVSVPCAIGIPVNVTYGAISRNSAPPPLYTYDQIDTPVSGSRQIFVWD